MIRASMSLTCIVPLLALACAAPKEPEPAPLPAVAACEPVPSDSLEATLYLTLRPGGWRSEGRGPATARERRVLALALQAVHQAMTPPDPALAATGARYLYRGGAVPGTSPEAPHPTVFTVATWDAWRRGRAVLAPALRLRAILHPDGRLTQVEQDTPPSIMPALDRALAVALGRVGESQLLAGLLAELGAYGGAYGDRGGGAAKLDSLELSFRVGVEPDTLVGSWPLLRVTLPAYDSAALPMSLPGNPPPFYPLEARGRGQDGEVLVELVVTPDGRPELPTLRVLRATSRDFARAVEKVVPRYRFMPAEANGCAMPMAVQMPFNFDVL
jgi:TonB family protein